MTGVLVHEWIARAGGSENVFEAMSRLYPESDLLCLWNDSEGRFEEERLTETWLSRTPLRRSKAGALPFLPTTWRHAPDNGYDWALISSHLFAHHARFDGVSADDRFVYVHSPARYIWTPELDRRGHHRAVRTAAAVLKPLDRKRAQETKHVAANSQFVRQRIAETWEVESIVIHPPVEVAEIQRRAPDQGLGQEDRRVLDDLPGHFLLGASRFIPYKRLDEVIRAGELAGTPVVLAGGGPEEGRLRARAEAASVPVTFVISPSTPLLYALYARASAFVFAAVEDFGIMPVEAMASGTPVVAQAVGGAAESVLPGVTGSLTTFESDDDLATAVDLALRQGAEACRTRALDFSVKAFQHQIRAWTGR